jgi:hypothetical protein
VQGEKYAPWLVICRERDRSQVCSQGRGQGRLPTWGENLISPVTQTQSSQLSTHGPTGGSSPPLTSIIVPFPPSGTWVGKELNPALARHWPSVRVLADLSPPGPRILNWRQERQTLVAVGQPKGEHAGPQGVTHGSAPPGDRPGPLSQTGLHRRAK